MTTTLVSGCSFTAGSGLDLRDKDPGLFINILAQQQPKLGQIKNIAQDGHSNERIFLDTALELSNNNFDHAVVVWTSYPRYTFWAGLETYECRRSFTPSNYQLIEHQGQHNNFSQADFKKLKDFFLLLNHDHYYILDLIRYINILINIARLKHTQIFFVNALCNWDTNYFNTLPDNLIDTQNFTTYTQQLINTKNRSQSEIFSLYKLIHQQYHLTGGIQENFWLNLYQDFRSLIVDRGNDNEHPGYQSHRNFAQLLNQNLILS